MDPSHLYAGLLASSCAENRMWGIGRWRELYGISQELVPLLDDDAPVVRVHGGRRFLVEVRAAALAALQDSYRRRRSGWDLGVVRVRRAMPVDEALGRAAASLDELDRLRRQEVLALAENALRERVGPPLSEDEPACRAYLVLLQLGQVSYHEQQVDPQTLLTPLQEEIHVGQMVSPRPRPHVRFDDPRGRPVGYLYRTDGRWVLDMDESPHAGQVTDMVRFWCRLSRGGVPRLVLDRNGAAQRHPSGQGLLTEGIVPHDTDEPLEYLRSVAAFVAQRQAAELVVGDDGAVRKQSADGDRSDTSTRARLPASQGDEDDPRTRADAGEHQAIERSAAPVGVIVQVSLDGWTRCPADEESGELTLTVSGKRLMAQTRMEHYEWDALSEGMSCSVDLELEPWPDERGRLRRVTLHRDAHAAGRLEPVDGVAYRLSAPVVRLEPTARGRHLVTAVHVDVGLGHPLRMEVGQSEVEVLAVGDHVAIEGVLSAWLQWPVRPDSDVDGDSRGGGSAPP